MNTAQDHLRAAMLASFETSPAFVADVPATSRSEGVRPVEVSHDVDLLARSVSGMARTTIVQPMVSRLFANERGSRDGLVLLHNFFGTEAEIIVVCRRFSWPRGAIIDAVMWAAFEVGVETLIARIRISDWTSQDLVRRAGFRFVQGPVRPRFEDGEEASIWRLTLVDESLIPRWYRTVGRAAPLPSSQGASANG